MLSRTQIRQFLAVVDTGSFTRAANALNVAQPSLSAGIAELERQLGTRLFVRERRRIQLTQAGNQLLPLARTIEREFHRAESQVGSFPVPARPVRLGLLETVATSWIESAVAAYAGSEPIEMTEGSERDLHAALVNGSLDLAITLVPAHGTQYRAESLFREDYCVALPTDHALASLDPVSAEALAGETMIARRACEVLADTSRFFTERGVRPRFSLRSANDDRVMAMVRAGMGITVAPRSLAQPGIAMVRLAQFERTRQVGIAFAAHWGVQFADDHPILRAIRQTTGTA